MERIRDLPNEIQTEIEMYTRKPQAKELLMDIKSFVNDFEMIKECYFFHYNIRILLFDLMEFCKKGPVKSHIREMAITKRIDPILFEHYLQYITFKDNGDIEIDRPNYDESNELSVIGSTYSKLLRIPSDKEISRRVREIWGLFNPTLRTKFINDYILLDDLEL